MSAPWVQLHSAQLDRQPLGELGLVLLGALTETERAPDLHPVPLDRPPRPVVRGPLLRGHPYLLGDVGHRGLNNLTEWISGISAPYVQMTLVGKGGRRCGQDCVEAVPALVCHAA